MSLESVLRYKRFEVAEGIIADEYGQGGGGNQYPSKFMDEVDFPGSLTFGSLGGSVEQGNKGLKSVDEE